MHSRSFAACFCALSLLVVAACGEEAAEKGKAEENLGASFASAADALSARLAAPGGQTQIPPASDPAVLAFDRVTGKAMAALGTDALPLNGFESYEALCGKTATIMQTYVASGIPEEMGEAQRLAAMEQNAARHMDQMFTPLLFSAHCAAAHMPFIDKTVSAGDMTGQAEALAQVRGGAFGQASGLIEMAGSGDLKPAQQLKIVDTLAIDAGKFAAVLSKAQRSQLAAMANQMARTLPQDVRSKVEAIKAGFEQAPCGKLCEM